MINGKILGLVFISALTTQFIIGRDRPDEPATHVPFPPSTASTPTQSKPDVPTKKSDLPATTTASKKEEKKQMRESRSRRKHGRDFKRRGDFSGTIRGFAHYIPTSYYEPQESVTTDYYPSETYGLYQPTYVAPVETIEKKNPIRRLTAEPAQAQLAEGFERVIYGTDECFIDESGRLICPAGSYVVKS